MNMSNKTYDTLKWIAMYLLPALGTLYFTLCWYLEFPIWRTDCRNHYCNRHMPWRASWN